ncbi:hypothetical protein, partial [Vibrio sinaloensis]|uniref:hypothetical protein n=1 Tax=Photobacterium sp. (strain ATCC 43367) TaxID=379097 RepID=UPI002F40C1A2
YIGFLLYENIPVSTTVEALSTFIGFTVVFERRNSTTPAMPIIPDAMKHNKNTTPGAGSEIVNPVKA